MNAPVLRLLDANANRAREALRVVEDYARFVLDDGDLSAALKGIRHELVEATRAFVAAAILHRDTPGDVGTGNKTESELARADVADVVTAAGKRLGEALRAIEEFLKTLSPADAAKVEALRYRFYDIEHRLTFSLRPGQSRFTDVRLYVLITESCCKRPWLEAAAEAIRGGADCLQLREKDFDSGELLTRARLLVELCRRHDVLCIINDRPDIALLSGADGVHLGQTDLPARDVRKLLGPHKIVGVSTHRIEQAKQAVRDGADYVGVGPFFRSATKPRDFVAGPEYARRVAEEVAIPAVAIAGITAGNVDEVMATGIKAVAVTAAVVGREDVRGAAAGLKARLTGNATAASPVAQAFLPVVTQTFLSVPHPSRDEGVEIKGRNLPHGRMDGATYFVTFRLIRGEMDERERGIVLGHIKAGRGMFYSLLGAVVMPDHAHLVLTPNPDVNLSRITKGIKGVTARLVNVMRKATGPFWQDESWDRIIRDQDELSEKLTCIVNNPVRAGLVEDGWDYEALFIIGEKE